MTTPSSSSLSVLPAVVDPLPIAGDSRPALRADALRNRERVICAAARVVERDGAAGLTMEAVAEEAGVGKGTVFRRFGDRSSLLMALVDEEERRLQDAVLSGAPPLGPGADPLDRLLAFGDARIDHLVRHGELLAAAEERSLSATPEQHPVVVASRFHVIHLLRLAGHSQECASALSSALLGFLSGNQVHQLVASEGHDEATLKGAWRTLVTGVMSGASPQTA